MNTPATTAAQTYRRLMRQMLRYKAVFFLSLIAVALDAAGQGLFFYLLRPLIDETIVATDPVFSWWLPGLVMGAVVLRIVGNFGGGYGMEWVGRRLIADLRQEIFKRYMSLPSAYYDQHTPGKMISVISYDAEQVAQGATTALIGTLRDIMTVLALLGVMLIQSWRLTLAMVLLVPVVILVVTVISSRFRRLSSSIQDSMGDVTHLTEEVVNGHEVIKVYGGQEHESERFSAQAQTNRRLHLKLAATQLISSSLIQLAAGVSVVILLTLAISDWLQESISAGIFMSVLAAMVACIPPLKRLTRLHVVIEKALAAAQSIFAIIDAPAEPNRGHHQPQCVRGHVVFKQVSLTYPGATAPVLKEISVELRPGTMTAVVGRSGAGKSSLMKLIPRFYEAQRGQLLIDGIDVTDYELVALRQQIALVSQEVVLFNDTVGANIAYGHDQAVSRERIEQAAINAYAMDFIHALPDGLDTLIGPGGVSLSGGQRQRIAIARAFVKDAPILLLDEATSALDTESQQWVQKALDRLMADRTTLVIAHQLSTVERADQVLVLDQGRLVEVGTHLSLVAQADSLYHHLYHLQFNAKDDA